MFSDDQILLKHMDVDGIPQQDKLIHNLRFIRIARMLRKRLSETSRFSLKQLIDIVLSDPTTHMRDDQLLPGKYCEWLVKQYLQFDNKVIFWEDLYKISDDLLKFHQLKVRGKIPHDKRDILHIKNANDLFDVIYDKENEIVLNGFPDYRHLIQDMDAVLVHSSETRIVYALLSFKASREIGSGTRWCTVANPYQFEYYSGISFIYVIFSKKNVLSKEVERHQIHFASNQFANINDKMVFIDHLFTKDMKKDMIQFAFDENDPFALMYFDQIDLLQQRHFNKIVKYLFSERSTFVENKMLAIMKSKKWNEFSKVLSSLEMRHIFCMNPTAINCMYSPTKDMKIGAIMGDAKYIRQFPEFLKDDESIMDIVKIQPAVITYIDKPSRAIQLLMAKIGKFSLIGNPLPEVRLNAIERNHGNLKFIKNPTNEEIELAMSKSVDVIEHIEFPTEKIQVAAVKEKPSLIKKIKNPCHKAQKMAVDRNFKLIHSIRNPYPDVQRVAKDLEMKAKKNLKNVVEDGNKKRRWKNMSSEERMELFKKQKRW
jgi:hypothetical protein